MLHEIAPTCPANLDHISTQIKNLFYTSINLYIFDLRQTIDYLNETRIKKLYSLTLSSHFLHEV